MFEAVKANLKGCDIFIAVAAVADYRAAILLVAMGVREARSVR